MKRTLILLSIFFIIVSTGLNTQVNADEKTNVKQKKPIKKDVKQKTAGKAPIKEMKNASTFSDAPFKIDGHIIPKNYLGHDLREIYNRLEARQNRKKGEFETTAEYNARIEQEKKAPLYGTINIGDKLTLVIDTMSSYDADNNKLTVAIPSEPAWRKKFDMGIKGQEIYNSKKNYIGSNAYGATAEITEYFTGSAILVVKNSSKYEILGELFKRQMNIILDNIKVDDAKKIKNQVSAVCIFTLTEPYIAEDGYYSKATINKPTEMVVSNKLVYGSLEEIILYNKQTGDIISRILPK